MRGCANRAHLVGGVTKAGVARRERESEQTDEAVRVPDLLVPEGFGEMTVLNPRKVPDEPRHGVRGIVDLAEQSLVGDVVEGAMDDAFDAREHIGQDLCARHHVTPLPVVLFVARGYGGLRPPRNWTAPVEPVLFNDHGQRVRSRRRATVASTRFDDALMAELAIEVRGLYKSYGSLEAVAGVDLSIERGEIFALLGPNGAGKTTTVEILEGYRSRDAGQVSVLGYDPGHERAQLKREIGIVLQSTGIDRYLSVAETIAMYSSYYPTRRPVDEVIDLVGLTEKRDTRVLQLSGGQQRRLDVAIALAGDPELLFLDEPTTGFDPSARRGAWELVRDLAALGKTVLLTTHYMDEAQYLADRVAVISAGRIVAEGAPATIAGRNAVAPMVRFGLEPGVAMPEEIPVATGASGRLEFRPEDLRQGLNQLTSWALGAGVELVDLEIVRPTLEDVYLELTGGHGVAESTPHDAAPKRRGRHR